MSRPLQARKYQIIVSGVLVVKSSAHRRRCRGNESGGLRGVIVMKSKCRMHHVYRHGFKKLAFCR